MARTPIWKSIATHLRDEITAGQFAQGDKLPTEAALAARFGVNRHTVRHALGALADEGVVYARRGAGVFVTQVPTDYPIGKRVRFHQNLTLAGRVPAKEILSLETRAATAAECKALQLGSGAQVHDYHGMASRSGWCAASFRRRAFPICPLTCTNCVRSRRRCCAAAWRTIPARPPG